MYLHIYVVERKKQMIKKVIDEKIKQYQDLKEWFEKLDLSNESIVHLLNISINDLETIKFLYLHELNAHPKTCYPNGIALSAGDNNKKKR